MLFCHKPLKRIVASCGVNNSGIDSAYKAGNSNLFHGPIKMLRLGPWRSVPPAAVPNVLANHETSSGTLGAVGSRSLVRRAMYGSARSNATDSKAPPGRLWSPHRQNR